MIQLKQPADRSMVPLLDDTRKAIVNDPRWEIPHQGGLIKTVQQDLSKPDPVIFSWEGETQNGVLEISRSADFQSPDYVICPENGCSVVPVYNLFAEQQYFWRVKTDSETSEIFSFTTESNVKRLIHLPDVTNVRDLGPMKTSSGRKIRQGLLYRGGQFNHSSPLDSIPVINDAGIRILLQDLKVRTELDLRGEGSSFVSNAHSELCYINLKLSAYATWKTEGIFSPDQKANLAMIFHILSRKEFYPVYFHCAGGGDRTGTLSFLLEMILGVPEEDAIRDYEYSILSISGERNRFTEVWVKFMERLDTYPGSTRKEKVENFLLECSVTEETLHAIRKILLEEDLP